MKISNKKILLLSTALLLALSFGGYKFFISKQNTGPKQQQKLKKSNINPALLVTQRMILAQDTDSKGRRYALNHCQSCHLFAEPKMLTKQVWKTYVLPKMGLFLGMQAPYPQYYQSAFWKRTQRERNQKEKDIIKKAGIYPDQELVSKEEWEEIMSYYENNAPEKPLPPIGENQIINITKLFQVKLMKPIQTPPMTALIQIDQQEHRILMGNAMTNVLSIIDSNGNTIDHIKLQGPPIAVRRKEDLLWVTDIGILAANDLPAGNIFQLKRVNGKWTTFPGNERIRNLQRPVYTTFADLNNDGIEDIIVSEFGNQVGRFGWYQGRPNGSFLYHILSNEPGAMTSTVHDFNQDGLPDIAVIYAQNREGIFIYYNAGMGNFLASYVVQLPPSYGSSYFELVDFNHDGAMDFLVTNGDNGDYPSILKNYHGIRIYLNNGKNHFKEHFFYHQNGAYKAMANDFDGDGDQDIVAISAYPDFVGHPEEGFVYLENQGNLKFIPYQIKQTIWGRWVTMDIGDVDGDGDFDVVLGSYILHLDVAPEKLSHQWKQMNRRWHRMKLPGMILINKTIKN